MAKYQMIFNLCLELVVVFRGAELSIELLHYFVC